MAKPNYQYEKRQRDLAKKTKQEEKRRQKLAQKVAEDAGLDPSATSPTDDNGTVSSQPGESASNP